MVLTIFCMVVAFILPSVLYSVSWVVSARSHSDREKSSPFECGFDPKNSARLPFSLRFFLLAVIFLVFDIEIVLLMALPVSLKSYSFSSLIGGFIFVLILLGGLFHEWREGSLDWAS